MGVAYIVQTPVDLLWGMTQGPSCCKAGSFHHSKPAHRYWVKIVKCVGRNCIRRNVWRCTIKLITSPGLTLLGLFLLHIEQADELFSAQWLAGCLSVHFPYLHRSYWAEKNKSDLTIWTGETSSESIIKEIRDFFSTEESFSNFLPFNCFSRVCRKLLKVSYYTSTCTWVKAVCTWLT